MNHYDLEHPGKGQRYAVYYQSTHVEFECDKTSLTSPRTYFVMSLCVCVCVCVRMEEIEKTEKKSRISFIHK